LEICDREPTPEEAAVLAEMIEELLKEFEGRPGDILLLLLADYPAGEISRRIGCTERTVYRTYKNVKEWLNRRAEE
jgi:DNA-directed RNA polymerase specialized sigma24 family protein